MKANERKKRAVSMLAAVSNRLAVRLALLHWKEKQRQATASAIKKIQVRPRYHLISFAWMTTELSRRFDSHQSV